MLASFAFHFFSCCIFRNSGIARENPRIESPPSRPFLICFRTLQNGNARLSRSGSRAIAGTILRGGDRCASMRVYTVEFSVKRRHSERTHPRRRDAAIALPTRHHPEHCAQRPPGESGFVSCRISTARLRAKRDEFHAGFPADAESMNQAAQASRARMTQAERIAEIRGVRGSVRLGARELDDLAPFVGFLRNEPPEVGTRAAKHRAAQLADLRS